MWKSPCEKTWIVKALTKKVLLKNVLIGKVRLIKVNIVEVRLRKVQIGKVLLRQVRRGKVQVLKRPSVPKKEKRPYRTSVQPNPNKALKYVLSITCQALSC